MALLPYATILADEVLAARESPQVLEELVKRADPFLYRLAENHKRYHPWDDVEDIYQEYRETMVRCIYKYDVSRAYDNGRGFIAFLNWAVRTDYRSHYRRLEASYQVRDWSFEEEVIDDTIPWDIEAAIQKARSCLSEKDQEILDNHLAGAQIPGRILDRICREMHAFMLEESL